jgi:hypothetical protein
MSKAHLQREAFSTGEKHRAKAPSFKAIFDCCREKGGVYLGGYADEGDESKLKTEQKPFCKCL